MIEIPEVTDAELAFGIDMKKVPKMEMIPDMFKEQNTKWNKFASTWFFKGLNKNVSVDLKDGVDGKKAFRALKALLGSFSPQHEHKEAACAYWMSEWFNDYDLGEEL